MDWAAVGRKGEAATLNAQLVGALDTAPLADALEYGRPPCEIPRLYRRDESRFGTARTAARAAMSTSSTVIARRTFA
jgi:hypothetical protein